MTRLLTVVDHSAGHTVGKRTEGGIRLLAGLGVKGEASVRITGLRNPCRQLNDFRPGLMQAVLGCDRRGKLVREAGIMGVVVSGGEVRAGDAVRVEPPPGTRRPLQKV